jgi:RNA recognition motif-containing protein
LFITVLKRKEDKMTKKLFVGNLSWTTTNDSLRDLFATVGNVVSAQVIMDKFTGKSRGFGFVEMDNEEAAKKAADELNGKELDGRAIAVNEAREQEDRGNRNNNYRDNNRRDDRRNDY